MGCGMKIPAHQVGGLLRVWVMRGYGLIEVGITAPYYYPMVFILWFDVLDKIKIKYHLTAQLAFGSEGRNNYLCCVESGIWI